MRIGLIQILKGHNQRIMNRVMVLIDVERIS